MSELKKFDIPAFTGVKPEGVDQQAVSYQTDGSHRGRAVGASWARTAYNPISGDLMGNHIAKSHALASIETQARNQNNDAAQDQEIEMLDVGAVIRGATETMAIKDQEIELLSKKQSELNAINEARAKEEHKNNEIMEQQAQQQGMLTTILPPLIGAGAGISYWKHKKDFGMSMLVGAGAWCAAVFIAPKLARGFQSVHSSGVVPVLNTGAQVAGIAKRIV